MPPCLYLKKNNTLVKKIESSSKIVLVNKPCLFCVRSSLKYLVVVVEGQKRCSKYVRYYKSSYSAVLSMPSLSK
jgi:hypothetical protein